MFGTGQNRSFMRGVRLTRVFVRRGSTVFDKIDMTLDQGRKPRDTGKNGHIKLPFLLGKSAGMPCLTFPRLIID